MTRQKQINKMLSKIKSKRNVYSTYGRIVKITAGTLALIIATLPLCTAWLYPLVPFLSKYEIVRVSI